MTSKRKTLSTPKDRHMVAPENKQHKAEVSKETLLELLRLQSEGTSGKMPSILGVLEEHTPIFTIEPLD